MKLVFLGTGGTYPSKIRNVTSIALRLPGDVLLFDCGEGTQRQLMRSSISFMKISRIFISHLHADHFLGLPGLIQSMSLNGRESDLLIYGPKDTRRNVDAMMGLGYFRCGFKVRVEELGPGARLDLGGCVVKTARAKHTIPALAYSVEENKRPGKFNLAKAKKLGIPPGPMYRTLQEGASVKYGGRRIRPEEVLGAPRAGRKVVYTGDTKPSREIVALARNADALIHDCTLDSRHSAVAARFGHSTAAEASRVAKEARAKVLFLVHISPRYEDHSGLEREARKVFKKSIVATDMMEYAVEYSD
jgi:ribonuclease Z